MSRGITSTYYVAWEPSALSLDRGPTREYVPPMACAYYLPSELWDRIIDELWDDGNALAACALTRREWLSRARSHLWGNIHCTTPRVYCHLRIILQESANLAPLIKVLTITLSSLNDFDWICQLPSLRSLTLHGCRLTPTFLNIVTQPRLFSTPTSPDTFISLVDFYLHDTILDVGSFCLIVRAMPNLASLGIAKRSEIGILDVPVLGGDVPNATAHGQLSCRLQSLRWHLTKSQRGVLLLCQSSPCRTLRNLTLVMYRLWHQSSVTDLANASTLLRNAGTSLATLTLFVRYMKLVAPPTSLPETALLDLSRNTNLISLDIRFWRLRPMRCAVDPAALLSCIKPTHSVLERVDVSFVILPNLPLFRSPNKSDARSCDLSRECVRLLRQNSRRTLTFHILGHAESAQAARRALVGRLQTYVPWEGVDTERLRFVHNYVADPAAFDPDAGWQKLDAEHGVPLFSDLDGLDPGCVSLQIVSRLIHL